MRNFIHIIISILIGASCTNKVFSQSKVFNNVYNDYSYVKDNDTENVSFYNNEALYKFIEFNNSYSLFGSAYSQYSIGYDDSVYVYGYNVNTDEYGDTINTVRLDYTTEGRDSQIDALKINDNTYSVGFTQNPSFDINSLNGLFSIYKNGNYINFEFNMGDDNKFVTIKTNDNGATFQVLGFADVDTAGINYDAFISTIDSSGNLISNIQLGELNGDFLYALEYLDNGNYLLCGHTFNYGSEISDIWLLEMNPNGTIVWQKTFGNQYYDRIANSKGMIVKDNHIYIAGRSGEEYPDIPLSVVGYFIKTDMQGNSLWEKKYVKGEWNEEFMGLQSFDDETMIIGGQTYFYSDTAEYPIGWILKVDTNGNTIWERTIQKYTPADNAGDEPHHYVYDMLVSSDKGILLGGYIIANYITDENGFFHRNDAWLAKTDSCGFTVGDIPEPLFVVDSIQHSEENHTVFITDQSKNYCTAELDWGDPEGSGQVEKYYAYENNLPLAEKQFQHNYTQDGSYTIKTTTLAGEEFRDYETTIDIVGVGISEQSEEKNIISLFPNPGNDYTIVENPNAGKIPNQVGHDVGFEMGIFSLNGKQVQSFNLNAKLYQQKIHISGLNNGVYFVKFEIDGVFVGLEKLVIAR